MIYIFLLNFGYSLTPYPVECNFAVEDCSGDNSTRSCGAPEKLFMSAAEFAGGLSIYTVFLCLRCGGMLYCVCDQGRVSKENGCCRFYVCCKFLGGHYFARVITHAV